MRTWNTCKGEIPLISHLDQRQWTSGPTEKNRPYMAENTFDRIYRLAHKIIKSLPNEIIKSMASMGIVISFSGYAIPQNAVKYDFSAIYSMLFPGYLSFSSRLSAADRVLIPSCDKERHYLEWSNLWNNTKYHYEHYLKILYPTKPSTSIHITSMLPSFIKLD